MSDPTTYPPSASDAVLDAAEILFAAHGFSPTSLSVVGRTAGLSRGAPAYFFASKRGLYLAVVRRGLGRLETALAASPTPTGTNRHENVAALIHAHLRVMLDEEDIFRILQRDALDGWLLGDELGSELDRLRAHVELVWASALGVRDERLRRTVAAAVAVASAVWAFGPAAADAILGERDDGSLRDFARDVAALVCSLA